jgi:hemerythrin superfamily protein
MSEIDTGATRTASQTDDIVAAIRRDHGEIKDLFGRVESASGADGRENAFRLLVAKLAMHETAEEEIVHPLLRKEPGGEEIADRLLAQEDQGKKLLAELEKMGPAAPEFDSKFRTLRAEVLEHADQEEQLEHPRIEQSVDADRRRKLAQLFETAEAAAPTHAHPNAPESAAGNLVLGPFVAVADRVRDAIRSARDKH